MAATTGTCSVPDCTGKAGTKSGVCRKHYRQEYYRTHREHEIKTATARAKNRKRPSGSS